MVSGVPPHWHLTTKHASDKTSRRSYREDGLAEAAEALMALRRRGVRAYLDHDEDGARRLGLEAADLADRFLEARVRASARYILALLERETDT